MTEPTTSAITQAQADTPSVHQMPEISRSMYGSPPPGISWKKTPQSRLNFTRHPPRAGRVRGGVARAKQKGRTRRIRRPAPGRHESARPRALQTPLSFGFANASLIAGVTGKFMLMPLGGIGLVNHLA